jgi:NAD(P)H-hydrate epimerase
MKYVSVQEMIEIEKAADAAGHTYQDMMEAAGKGLAEEIHLRFKHLKDKTVLALVGSGNNGGDALVALDYLGLWGWKLTALILKSRPKDDPLLTRVVDRGGYVVDWTDLDKGRDQVKDQLSKSELVIDGVLGTGIKLPLRDPLKSQLNMVKVYISLAENRPVVIAVDCPSGVDCDSGEVDPGCIPADLTVTMAAVKKGLLKFPAYSYLGKLCLVEIGLPENLAAFTNISREIITVDWVKSELPLRPLDAHKGVFGTALIIAGSINYPGAAILAGEAAYRSGAGLVTIAVPGSIYDGLIKRLPEATWIKLLDNQGGISSDAVNSIETSLDKPTALLVGPGLGLSESTAAFLAGLLKLNNLPPLVLDADGLRLARHIDGWPGILPDGSILTPHPGEMAALTGLSTKDIQSERENIAEESAKKWNQVIVLKGAHTVIADPDGETMIYEGGDPGLARAGSGDVLAGIIAGLIAQNIPPFIAAVSGVWIHGQAGKLAGKKVGSQASVLASDISDQIGEVYPA